MWSRDRQAGCPQRSYVRLKPDTTSSQGALNRRTPWAGRVAAVMAAKQAGDRLRVPHRAEENVLARVCVPGAVEAKINESESTGHRSNGTHRSPRFRSIVSEAD